MALQLAFAKEILCKSYNNEGSRRVKLVKRSSRTPIIDTLCIKVWTGILIFVVFISILTMSICLVRACFSFFFHKFIIFKIKFRITLEYIIVYRKTLEILISSKKLVQNYCYL